jgi:hypothetical protein
MGEFLRDLFGIVKPEDLTIQQASEAIDKLKQ